MNKQLKSKYSEHIKAFAFSACAALAIFLPFVIVDGGIFIYCGDFNSQQLPFYAYATDFVKTSVGQWSWETDLGTSFINAYSYYLVGSPFFWLSAIFPTWLAPYLMVPMFAVKFGTIGLGAYCYLNRYASVKSAAVLCSVIYALSGFNIYNTFFNSFLDCTALFPFMLWGLDEFVYNKKIGVFALFIALNCLNNYFFFAGQIVFIFIYFFVKLACKSYKITLPRFLLLAFESLLGVAMGCALLIPAILNLSGNPRTDDIANGFSLLMYSNVQQYFAIFTSAFLVPDPPYLPSIYNQGIIKWTSMSVYLPIVGMVGVVAYMRAKKKSWITLILAICFFMAFVPMLNSSFYMLNSSFYARWYYMPMLIMCLATMYVLQSETKTYSNKNSLIKYEYNVLGALKIVGTITVAFIIFGIIPTKVDDIWQIGVANNLQQFWVMWLTSVLGILLFYIAWRFKKGSLKFLKLLFTFVLSFSIFYCMIHISIGKFTQWENDKDYTEEMFISAPNIEWPESDNYYRTDSYETVDNIGLMTEKSNIQFFTSVVTPSIMEFYPMLGLTRDVRSNAHADDYALRGLLGVKYTIVKNDESATFDENHAAYGWQHSFTSGIYEIYENIHYSGMCFAYDKYIEMSALESIDDTNKSHMLIRAIGLTDEQIQKYSQYIQPAINTEMTEFDYSSYARDIAQRELMSAQTFVADGSGFTTTIQLNAPSLVYFAVPYDVGFTATVNGQEVEIEKVSGGMMAVLASEGHNEIVFTYKTPGFALGLTIALSALFIWILYNTYNIVKNRRNKKI